MHLACRSGTILDAIAAGAATYWQTGRQADGQTDRQTDRQTDWLTVKWQQQQQQQRSRIPYGLTKVPTARQCLLELSTAISYLIEGAVQLQGNATLRALALVFNCLNAIASLVESKYMEKCRRDSIGCQRLQGVRVYQKETAPRDHCAQIENFLIFNILIDSLWCRHVRHPTTSLKSKVLDYIFHEITKLVLCNILSMSKKLPLKTTRLPNTLVIFKTYIRDISYRYICDIYCVISSKR